MRTYLIILDTHYIELGTDGRGPVHWIRKVPFNVIVWC